MADEKDNSFLNANEIYEDVAAGVAVSAAASAETTI